MTIYPGLFHRRPMAGERLSGEHEREEREKREASMRRRERERIAAGPTFRRRHAAQIIKRARWAATLSVKGCRSRIHEASQHHGAGLGLFYELNRLEGRVEGLNMAARLLDLDLAPATRAPIVTCDAQDHISEQDYLTCENCHPRSNARAKKRKDLEHDDPEEQ